jgi:peptide/nickel transport system substrate-binding protein
MASYGIGDKAIQYLLFYLFSIGEAILLMLSTASPTVAAATPAARCGKTGGILKEAEWWDIPSLDPAFMTGPGDRRAGRMLYDGLWDSDATEMTKLLPRLAESWELQPDGKTFIVHLHKEVKFHDGTDFNAEVVKFHVERHLDPQFKSLRKSELEMIDKVEVVNPLTVKIVLKVPFAAFPYQVYEWAGWFVSPTAVRKFGEDFPSNPVGTGPYRFVHFVKGQELVVERNDNYWVPGVPCFDRIISTLIPDASARLAALRTGQVHIAHRLPPAELERMRKMPEIVVSVKDGWRHHYIHINVKTPQGAKKEFREAINWALDREAISTQAPRSLTLSSTPFRSAMQKRQSSS